MNGKFLAVLIIGSTLAGGVVKAEENPLGPLAKMVGVWEGDKGNDVAPAQKSSGAIGAPAVSPYFERISIVPGAGATNASEQELVTVQYHQEVFRKSDKQKFHDQVGYWIWDKKFNTILHSYCVPRAVCITAEGKLEDPNKFEVGTDRAIAESIFMKNNGTTRMFNMSMAVNGDDMKYNQVTLTTIYGKDFSHSDSNTLKRVKQ
ncbi:heme-binding beta-barrel domain-containing protein [Comamonas odontotermitis]|uniref:heme-binding beta-barrel domain-containing protein n=1 Tax=Comamonas odontotermitis TaxID=379895 RepID=UPI003751C8F8